MKPTKPPSKELIAIGGINIRNEGEDLIVMVDTGTELVEVLRVHECWNPACRTVDDTITSLEIEDAILGREEFASGQTRIKYR